MLIAGEKVAEGHAPTHFAGAFSHFNCVSAARAPLSQGVRLRQYPTLAAAELCCQHFVVLCLPHSLHHAPTWLIPEPRPIPALSAACKRCCHSRAARRFREHKDCKVPARITSQCSAHPCHSAWDRPVQKGRQLDVPKRRPCASGRYHLSAHKQPLQLARTL